MASAKRFGAFSYVSRNVKRRSLRSAITVTGISVVIAFFILFASISQGLKDDIMEEIERQNEALLEQRAGFITLMILDPFSSNLFNGSELEQTDQYVKEYCAEHNTTGEAYPLAVNFLKSEEPDSDDMFLLFGIDPEKGVKYDFITFNNETVSLEGAYLSPTGGAEILLGNNVLQSNYPGVGVGDTIDIETVSYIAGASAILDNVTVTGILDPSIIYDNFAAMPIEYLLENTGLYDNTTDEYFYMFISIWVEDASLIDFAELKAGIKEIAGLTDRDISDNENYIKRTILAHEEEIAKQEEMKRTIDGWLMAVIVLLSIITVVGISNTMLMSVTERRREIGTLKAVGISKARIYQLVLGEAFVLVLISLIIGGITGVALAEYFDSQYDAEAGGIFFAPTNLTPFVLTYVVCISIGVAMLAALYPAWQAARLEPTEALRYE